MPETCIYQRDLYRDFPGNLHLQRISMGFPCQPCLISHFQRISHLPSEFPSDFPRDFAKFTLAARLPPLGAAHRGPGAGVELRQRHLPLQEPMLHRAAGCLEDLRQNAWTAVTVYFFRFVICSIHFQYIYIYNTYIYIYVYIYICMM